jgi:hypothetical protein
MFGGRLIPSALIGVGLASVLFVIGGIAEKLGILATTVSGTTAPLMALLGFSIPIGIGLYEDYKEGKAGNSTPTK